MTHPPARDRRGAASAELPRARLEVHHQHVYHQLLALPNGGAAGCDAVRRHTLDSDVPGARWYLTREEFEDAATMGND